MFYLPFTCAQFALTKTTSTSQPTSTTVKGVSSLILWSHVSKWCLYPSCNSEDLVVEVREAYHEEPVTSLTSPLKYDETITHSSVITVNLDKTQCLSKMIF